MSAAERSPSVDLGSVQNNFKPVSIARTNIIFPAIKFTGKQSKAEFPFSKPKNSTVSFALSFIADFGNWISFGVPVEPEVLEMINSESEFHSLKKSRISFSQRISGFNLSKFPVEKSSSFIMDNLRPL